MAKSSAEEKASAGVDEVLTWETGSGAFSLKDDCIKYRRDGRLFGSRETRINLENIEDCRLREKRRPVILLLTLAALVGAVLLPEVRIELFVTASILTGAYFVAKAIDLEVTSADSSLRIRVDRGGREKALEVVERIHAARRREQEKNGTDEISTDEMQS